MLKNSLKRLKMGGYIEWLKFAVLAQTQHKWVCCAVLMVVSALCGTVLTQTSIFSTVLAQHSTTSCAEAVLCLCQTCAEAVLFKKMRRIIPNTLRILQWKVDSTNWQAKGSREAKFQLILSNDMKTMDDQRFWTPARQHCAGCAEGSNPATSTTQKSEWKKIH